MNYCAQFLLTFTDYFLLIFIAGILKSSKQAIRANEQIKASKARTLIGFTTSSLRLDATDPQENSSR